MVNECRKVATKKVGFIFFELLRLLSPAQCVILSDQCKFHAEIFLQNNRVNCFQVSSDTHFYKLLAGLAISLGGSFQSSNMYQRMHFSPTISSFLFINCSNLCERSVFVQNM